MTPRYTVNSQALREARLSKGLSMEDLGRLVNVKGASVCRWEQGINSPNRKRLKKLAKVLNIPEEKLILG